MTNQLNVSSPFEGEEKKKIVSINYLEFLLVNKDKLIWTGENGRKDVLEASKNQKLPTSESFFPKIHFMLDRKRFADYRLKTRAPTF